MEYESVMQVVIKILIGWNKAKQIGTNEIFGEAVAFGDSCEEQVRFMLHSHMPVWIRDFNVVRDLLFHKKSSRSHMAKITLLIYFEKIAQASPGDPNLTLYNKC